MPGRRKQFARADKAAAKAAHEIEATVIALMDKMAALPKVPMDYVEERVEDAIYQRSLAVYRFLRY